MRQSNKNLALSLLAAVVGMLLLAYASVPLYNVFCKVTGYGGTTQKSQKSSSKKGSRQIKVLFDANIDQNLPWEFKPEQQFINLITGENAVAFYSARNLTNLPIIGTAIYNVTPHKAGIYFNKIQCFCFEEQLLQPHESAFMPVLFFIDPDMESDPNMDDVDEITLSYRFYRVG